MRNGVGIELDVEMLWKLWSNKKMAGTATQQELQAMAPSDAKVIQGN